jgi:galactose mutarotase-like enzyme
VTAAGGLLARKWLRAQRRAPARLAPPNATLTRPYAAAAAAPAAAEFTYSSHDGEEGYPGAVQAVADYRLTADNELVMVFSATTDKATPINVCNHAYWNLSGGHKADVKGHVLKLHCSHYLPVGPTQVRARTTARRRERRWRGVPSHDACC